MSLNLEFRTQVVRNGDVNISVNVTGQGEPLHPEALAAFEEKLRTPDVIHATCKEYRAGASSGTYLSIYANHMHQIAF